MTFETMTFETMTSGTMTSGTFLWALTAVLAALVVYHHAIYPWLLRALAARAEKASPDAGPAIPFEPSVSIIVPAYREAAFIADKIRDLAALDYPKHKLDIVIACDGSPDETPDRAQDTLDALGDAASAIRLEAFAVNRGKVAVLNHIVSMANGEIVVLMDASAATAPDFLRAITNAFSEPDIGVVCPGYALETPGSTGEAAYWRYQSGMKAAEAALGAPMGAHGAAYAFRRALWEPLPLDIINDDFILPMRMVAQGARAVYRPDIRVLERETSRPSQDFARRRRIGAGNLQQVWACKGLLTLNRPALAFTFLSGKAMRALMPFILLGLLAASAALALAGGSLAAKLPLVAQAMLYALAGLGALFPALRTLRPVAYPHYFASGYFAAFLGAIDVMCGRYRDERRPAAAQKLDDLFYVDPATQRLKRVFDIIVGACAFVVFLVLLIPLAIAIRLDSKGPIFYRQLRVGRALPDRTELFYLIKLRTMRTDAESASGAVWAAKGDPRVTRLGRFLRKVRLDELPQSINVLRGDMSIVGPRPERPVFFTKLEKAIPFYAERTYGLKPGVTGLAQVSTGYDETIDDVRLKILFDHTYALHIRSPLAWLKTDLGIVFKTIAVMGLGMGR